MDDSINFLSLASFQNKYQLKVRPLRFFGIISAVKLLQQQIPRLQLKYENLLDTFLKNQKSSRIVYKKLISDKGEQPLPCQERWQKDIGSTTNTVNVDWRKADQLSGSCTRSSKLIDFNFRFLHRRLATKSFLQKKIGIKENGSCTFCHDKNEDLIHLFWECEKTRIFWNNLSIWLQMCGILSKENYLGMETALEQQPSQNNFSFFLKHMHQLENKTPSNLRKWKPLLPLLDRVFWILNPKSFFFFWKI